MSDVRILIVDDHVILREGIRLLLETQADFQVVGEAGNGVETIAMARKYGPDIILLDISMPKMDGLQAVGLLANACPQARVIVLSRYEKEAYACQALKNGAHGYLVKGAPSEELLEAIRAVARGRYYFSAAVQAAVVEGYVIHRPDHQPHPETTRLSERELDVLKLLVEGNSSVEIGEVLCISSKTVDKHRASIARKTGADNPVKMVQFALRTGILAPDYYDK
ncbi:DNA-binding response regulator [Geothermobacter hydrogeniphilus]|uniref:DNA-binding response regulator n=1 Tax=Geothermobacter hydrogeniphilus TaxID=1969733 RepID=A0A2K2HF49_9BACT|nr:response regulator transcription factor [Geothermobacter hydrogeniphilus]PNU21831.1 DNA-binding response regulator [Geothermobacter hydrogeniphilus]